MSKAKTYNCENKNKGCKETALTNMRYCEACCEASKKQTAEAIKNHKPKEPTYDDYLWHFIK